MMSCQFSTGSWLVITVERMPYREASCASVSLYDGEGERLSTVRMARMPESKKVTLKTMVGAEVEAVLGQRPDLQLVKIADGANDNWTFLSRVLPEGVELIDFFHAAQHLSDAFDAAYGANDPKAVAQFEKYRHLLRYDDDGVAQVIRALRHLRSKHPECERIAQVLGYFRNNRHRMGYAQAKDQGLPIGSGVVELIHPLILLSNDTKDSLEYPLLHKHLQKPLHQWTDSLIRPVGNMVIQHQPLTKQRVRTIFHRVRL